MSNWTNRIRGIRLNASCLSHAELNEASELDDGDVIELGVQVSAICERLPHINVVGGCCGTDLRHIREIGDKVRGTRQGRQHRRPQGWNPTPPAPPQADGRCQKLDK